MIEIDAPDGSVVEFPDGTSDAAIKAAMAKAYPKKEKTLERLGLRQAGPTLAAAASKRLEGMGPLRKTLYGGERALDEAAMGLKQVTVGLTPDEERELAIRRKMEEQTPGSWVGRTAADVALSLPVFRAASAAANTAKVIPAVANTVRNASPLAKTLAGLGGNAGMGAGYGALQPVLGEDSRATNTATGAVFGAGGKLAGDIGGRIIEGIVPKNPSIAKLPQVIRDRLTLGQTADRTTIPGSVAASTEEAAQSIPIAGAFIKRARNNARTAWREDLVNSTAPKGFTPVGENTWERINSAAGEYGKRYADALRNYQINPSQRFENWVLNITSNPRSGLTAQDAEGVRNMVMRYYTSMAHANPVGAGAPPISIDATNAKNFESFLTKQAMQWKRSNAPNASNMAQMFDDLERAWTVAYRRQLPSSARVATRELDQTYAPFKTVQRAASYTGNDYGDFTPQQLVQAVRSRTPEAKYSRGGGILQDEAAAARDSLIDRLPNSGTIDRGMTVGALTGLWADPTAALTTLAVGVPGMTTKVGRDLITGDTGLQELLRRLRMNQGTRLLGAPIGATAANQPAPSEFNNAP